MQKISRPVEPPSFLKSKIIVEEKHRTLNYLRLPADERVRRRDGLNQDVFFAPQLRHELSIDFHGKCAFCEEKLEFDGEVLHMRPRRFAAGDVGSQKDYYLWLAFEWRNIFYACGYCIKLKGDQFPVQGQRASYLSSFDDVILEESGLLIDPCVEDPSKHLKFLCHGEILGLTEKGKETVSVFALNRSDLAYERNKLIEKMFLLLENLDIQHKENDLRALLRIDAEYSGVLRGVLKRAATSWGGVAALIRGYGDTFVKKFLEYWREATIDRRQLLNSVLREMSEADRRAFEEYAVTDRVVSIRNEASLPNYYAKDLEISRMEISNFKAIESLHIDMRSARKKRSGMPSMMILGENSTGKSSLLSAIGLALIGQREAIKLKNYMPSLVRSVSVDRFDKLDQLKVEANVEFHFSSHVASFVFDSARNLIDGTEHPSSIVLGYGPRRFFDPKKRQPKSGGAAAIRTLFDPLATIPYPADWLRAQTGSKFDTVVSALRVVLALNDNDELIVEPDHLAVRANGRTTPINALSEGYRSVFAMTVDIFRELLKHWSNLERAQAVVLIDEIETHLHPRWKMQVMTSLRKVLPNVQFIATTHDPLCLRGMDDGEVVVLQRDAMNRIQRLQGLPSVSGMSAEQLLTSDYFGLLSTADPSVELELANLAGDFVRRSSNGAFEVRPSNATKNLIAQLTLGDSPSEQIIQDALKKYLEEREQRTGVLRPALRAEAVEAVISALRGSGAE